MTIHREGPVHYSALHAKLDQITATTNGRYILSPASAARVQAESVRIHAWIDRSRSQDGCIDQPVCDVIEDEMYRMRCDAHDRSLGLRKPDTQ